MHNNFIKKILFLIKNKTFIIFFILFLLILISNPIVSSIFPPQFASVPKKLGLVFANDFNTCVYVRSKFMVSGELMNQLGWVNSACGHIFPLIIAPFILLRLENNPYIYIYYSLFPHFYYIYSFSKSYLKRCPLKQKKLPCFLF